MKSPKLHLPATHGYVLLVVRLSTNNMLRLIAASSSTVVYVSCAANDVVVFARMAAGAVEAMATALSVISKSITVLLPAATKISTFSEADVPVAASDGMYSILLRKSRTRENHGLHATHTHTHTHTSFTLLPQHVLTKPRHTHTHTQSNARQ
jgi:hypothetical protein